MLMAKLIFVCFLVLGLALKCNAATTYIVGDNSGWDVSTDLDSWARDKRFEVGDALVFQYSSQHSLDEVTKEDFDNCNTTNVLRTFTNGNTTVRLSTPGTRYFVCGNQMHCLGGMKLQVNVEGNQANSPFGAPQGQPGGANPSSKSNNPSSVIPTSAGSVYGRKDCIVTAFLGFMAVLLPVELV